MKCQKCGSNEVSFHHSSIVNGCVTETHLCSRCAAESGFDFEKLFDFGGIFEGMLPMRGLSGFMPVAIPMMNSSNMFPFTTRPLSGMIEQGNSNECGCGSSSAFNANVEVDEEMKMRRELNAQMRAAVANEEFEMAAELRDKIKALESASEQQSCGMPETGRTNQCDSETTTQDSPTAQ